MTRKLIRLFVSASCLAILFHLTAQQAEFTADKDGVSSMLTCDYYKEEDFQRSVQQSRPYQTENGQGGLAAGVVPHHLLAGTMIASFFDMAAACGEYDTIVLVAPSHYPTGNKVITSSKGWQTPFGVLENDADITSRLTQSKVQATIDNVSMQRDHAVSGLIPYLKYYFPQSKVCAALIDNRCDWQRVGAIADELLYISKSKSILLVCSIDFSHYLMPRQAYEKDVITQEAIQSFDYQKISHFTDDHMDSPESLGVFLQFAHRRGTENITVLDHSGSDKILKIHESDPIYKDGITTYFTLAAFSKQ